MILLNNCDLLPSILLCVLRITKYLFQHTCLELFLNALPEAEENLAHAQTQRTTLPL